MSFGGWVNVFLESEDAVGKRPQEVAERAPLHVNAALHVCWAPRGWREQPSRVNIALHARWAPRQVMESLSAHSSSFSGVHVWGPAYVHTRASPRILADSFYSQ